jgi:hypothetical protein
MVESYALQELRELGGREVLDANGASVGFVDLVFVDDSTGLPEWLGIWSGVVGKGPRVVVPIRGIELTDGEIRAPWTKNVITSAPTYGDEEDRGLLRDDPDGIALSLDKEQAAYEHYGVDPLTPGPTESAGARFRAVSLETHTVQRR